MNIFEYFGKRKINLYPWQKIVAQLMAGDRDSFLFLTEDDLDVYAERMLLAYIINTKGPHDKLQFFNNCMNNLSKKNEIKSLTNITGKNVGSTFLNMELALFHALNGKKVNYYTGYSTHARYVGADVRESCREIGISPKSISVMSKTDNCLIGGDHSADFIVLENLTNTYRFNYFSNSTKYLVCIDDGLCANGTQASIQATDLTLLTASSLNPDNPISLLNPQGPNRSSHLDESSECSSYVKEWIKNQIKDQII